MALLQSELLRGTLDMLVLKALTVGPIHGWGLSQRLETMSRDVFVVNQGSLYPALQRLKRNGWVRSAWHSTENNRRAAYYQITRSGERQLQREEAQWNVAKHAVDQVLSLAFTGG